MSGTAHAGDNEQARTTGLTQADIARLAREPSPQLRAELVGKLASDYSANLFSRREAEIAVEIFRLLLRDVQERVRVELCKGLCHSLSIPHDIALRLAYDNEPVAVHMLSNSFVLTEEDLIEIAKSTCEVAKLCAIARRETVSAPLSEALIESSEKEVLHVLLNNRGAMIQEQHIMKAWEFLSAHESLLEALVHRGGLPLPIVEKLVPAVSDELRQALVHQYHLPEIIIDDAIDEAREWTTLGLMDAEFEEKQFSETDLDTLMEQLHKQGYLTPSLVIRALCVGDINFFEAAMARMAGVPRFNARILMFDSGPGGFEAFYKATRMPEDFFAALRVLIRLSLEETGYARYKRSDFRKRLIDRVYKEGYDKSVENMPYLLKIISGKADVRPRSA